MDAIENAAFTSVGRACGFSGLAIFCLMFGFAFDPALSARIGGSLCLLVSFILAAYAWRARSRPYKRTETWLILAKEERPPPSVAQQLIGQALRETYTWFARQSAVFAIVLLAASLVLDFADVGRWDEV